MVRDPSQTGGRDLDDGPTVNRGWLRFSATGWQGRPTGAGS